MTLCNRQINVLCLHGCRQTAAMQEKIMCSYIKIGKDMNMNFFFLEAEYSHSGCGKMWVPEELVIEEIGNIYYEDVTVDKCLERLDTYIKTNQINVLLGFSQGGNIIDTYLQNYENKIKCAVIISGYGFLYRAVDKNNKRSDVPLLNVYSESDNIVAPKYKPHMYNAISVIEHDYGHRHPTNKQIVRKIMDWISDSCKN